MPLYQVAVYHNAAAQFMPYQPEHPLMLVFTFARDLPDDTTAEQIADWTFRTFNVDLEVLEHDHATIGAETAFPLACLYRLLRLRSLSFPRKWRVLCLVVLLCRQARVGARHGRVTHGVAVAKPSGGVTYVMCGRGSGS